MSFASLAVVLVAIAFTALVVWVLLPANKARLEAHGAIPLEERDASPDRQTTEPLT